MAKKKAEKPEPLAFEVPKKAANVVTIKGIDYKLGGVEISDENFAVIERMSNMSDEDDTNIIELIKEFITDFRRMLREAIEDGEGKEKAEEALSNLKLSFSPQGDLMQSFSALMSTLMA